MIWWVGFVVRYLYFVVFVDGVVGIWSVNICFSFMFQYFVLRVWDGIWFGGFRLVGSGIFGGVVIIFVVFFVVLISSLGNGLSVFLIFVYSLVENVVVLEVFMNEEVMEDFVEVVVVWFVVEVEGMGVVQVNGEFVGEVLVEDFGGCCYFFFYDVVVFLFFSGSFQVLLWEGVVVEVQYDVVEGFYIIMVGLFDIQMCVDISIVSSISEVFVFVIRNVEVCFWVMVFFGQIEIDNVDLVVMFVDVYKEVVGFDIVVDE